MNFGFCLPVLYSPPWGFGNILGDDKMDKELNDILKDILAEWIDEKMKIECIAMFSLSVCATIIIFAWLIFSI